MFNMIKKNRNIIGITGACIVNNILYMFLNTFMVAYFITLTNYNYSKISIYYALSFVGILLTFLILGRTIKNKRQVFIFRCGIVLYCIYILIIALLKENITTYYAPLGFFYGIVQGLFWVACHVLINEYTNKIENKFISIKSMISKTVKIIFPIIFGISIEATSFPYIAKIILVLSVIQFSFSLLVQDKNMISRKKYDLKEYIRYIKNNEKFKIAYKINIYDGIVCYLLETLITILIVMTFKTSFNLGILTTIFSCLSILSVYIFQLKFKSNKKVLLVCCAIMVISVIALLFKINRITVIIYNLCASLFLVILSNTADTKNYSIVNEDQKVIDEYLVEHQVLAQTYLNISRIISYILLFIASLFNNILFFKIMMIFATMGIVGYSKAMMSLDTNENNNL